ncbi:MAG: hypothetical protein EA411_07130 [Saprospirales bacterium]|nr:MAG: hypothetical protein EA411_07130 [Saprospirales bacterium]
MNFFKCIFFPVFLLLSCLLLNTNVTGQVQERDMVWCNGTSQTSNGWDHFRLEMGFHGFQFDQLLDNQWPNAWGQGVLAGADYIDYRINLRSGSDVLGIGHGFGGIALRYAQHLNSDISAMVLSGVPNQGSFAIGQATLATPNGVSKVSEIIERIESVKLGDNCQDCNVTGLFKSWINTIEGGKDFIGDLSNDSDVILNINKPAYLPTIPYIVLYGTVEDFSLVRMLDTKFSIGDGTELVECQEERIREESKNIENLEIQRTIRNTNGFFANVLGFAGSLLSAGSGSPGAALSAISNYINQETNRIIQEIQAQQEIENELARMLRCQLANQLQEAEWMLMMLDGSFEVTEVFVDMTTQEDIDLCMLDCEMDFSNDPNSIHHCQNWCSQNLVIGEYVTTTVFVAELTNGLLAESEQKLPGSNMVAEIHLPNTNHFQMTSRTQEVLVDEFKDNIFSGALGAAFIVPTN